MPRSDRDQRVERLRVKAQERSAQSLAAARRALMALQARGEPVSVKTVAEEAGVSESFLMKNEGLRRQISALRGQQPRARGDGQSHRSVATLKTQLEVAVQQLQTIKAENQRLRDENTTLRGALLEARRATHRDVGPS